MDTLVVVLTVAVAWIAVCVFISLFCSTNEREESGRPMRIGSRVAERVLTLGDGLERSRRRHYRACDQFARCRRPGYVELRPNASRGRRTA